MSISGPGKADVLTKEQKDGLVRIVYMPLSPGEYDIVIKNKGRVIHGSPFNAKISGKCLISRLTILISIYFAYKIRALQATMCILHSK